MRIICRELQSAWHALALEFQFEQRQKPGQAQQLMPPEGKMLCLSFEVTMKDCRGTMSVAVPTVISSALLRKLSVARPQFYTQLGSPDSANHLRKVLHGCPFRLELGLTASASSAELAGLSPGKILVLNRRAESVAELFAGERPIFQARVAGGGRE